MTRAAEALPRRPVTHAILVPGIGDRTELSRRFHGRVAGRLTEAGIPTTIFQMNWDIGEGFREKFDQLNRRVRELIHEGVIPYTGGTSLGGAAAVAAFIHNPEVGGAFTVSSRLTPHADTLGLTNLRRLTEAGADMINWLGENFPNLEEERRSRIMTMRLNGGDEKVAASVSTLPGAIDRVFPFEASHDQGIGRILEEPKTAHEIVDFFAARAS